MGMAARCKKSFLDQVLVQRGTLPSSTPTGLFQPVSHAEGVPSVRHETNMIKENLLLDLFMKKIGSNVLNVQRRHLDSVD